MSKNISLQLRTLAIILVLCSGLACGSAQAQDYDLAILNGRVMNPESGLDAVRSVGIKDGKIAAITDKAIRGKGTIDAKGHVAAPGFIDTHWHSLDPFGIKIGLRDGRTWK